MNIDHINSLIILTFSHLRNCGNTEFLFPKIKKHSHILQNVRIFLIKNFRLKFNQIAAVLFEIFYFVKIESQLAIFLSRFYHPKILWPNFFVNFSHIFVLLR